MKVIRPVVKGSRETAVLALTANWANELAGAGVLKQPRRPDGSTVWPPKEWAQSAATFCALRKLPSEGRFGLAHSGFETYRNLAAQPWKESLWLSL